MCIPKLECCCSSVLKGGLSKSISRGRDKSRLAAYLSDVAQRHRGMKCLVLYWVQALNVSLVPLHPSTSGQKQCSDSSPSDFSRQNGDIALKSTLVFMAMHFVPDNCCSVIVPSPPSVLQRQLGFCYLCCLMPVKSAKPMLALHCGIDLLFSQVKMTGNFLLTPINCHVPVRRGREFCSVSWSG